MSKIFISYSYADGAEIARQLVSELEAAGSTCWMGQRDIKTGEDFPAQIVTAIKECRALVVLLTPGANGSRDVLQEVSLAHNDKKPMVPLIVRNTSPSGGLLYYLGIVQQFAWSDARTAAAAVRTLLTDGAVSSIAAATTVASMVWLRAWLVSNVIWDIFCIAGGVRLSFDHALLAILFGFACGANIASSVLIWNLRRMGFWAAITPLKAVISLIIAYEYVHRDFATLFLVIALMSMGGSGILALLVRPHWARFK